MLKLGTIILLVFASISHIEAVWTVGIGRADATGPVAGVEFMGYAHPDQIGEGLHLRSFSRAFIFDDGVKRAAFVSVDMGMMGQLVKLRVIENLRREFGSIYDYENVVLSGTHTHSAPAGYLQYVLFDVTARGFSVECFDALVEGITESIRRAHNNMQPANLFYHEGVLPNANINRSPTSYLANPEEERNRYTSDTDHIFAQLIIKSSPLNEPIGLINWFAVHPVSMNNQNHLVSSDNKGTASLIVESTLNPDDVYGEGSFVAAFASTNLGDTSPNLNGPKCIDTGLPCDDLHSTCDGRNEMCIANGPGENIFESTWIIAQRQADLALQLLNDEPMFQDLGEGLDYIYQWVNMSDYDVVMPDSSVVKTCKPALGYSFAAGCTDGPGAFDFVQGSNDTTLFWEAVVGFLKDPTPEQDACHAPKPILLDTGEAEFPHAWHPTTIDTQILKLGDLFIAAMPGELTTMSGRRMRDTLMNTALANGANPFSKFVLAGLSNVYTHYITTFEEYQRQRYEAASTIFGPHSLRAYQQQYSFLMESLLQGTPVDIGTSPPDLYDEQLSFLPEVPVDTAPAGLNFGDCIVQPSSSYAPGDIVNVSFVSAHPRNDVLLEGSFLLVEEEVQLNTWQVRFTDANWETRFHWKADEVDDSQSTATITWDIPLTQTPGNYRISHFGTRKLDTEDNKAPFQGSSQTFSVV